MAYLIPRPRGSEGSVGLFECSRDGAPVRAGTGGGSVASQLWCAGCPWLKSPGEWSSKSSPDYRRALRRFAVNSRASILDVGSRQEEREEGTLIGKRREVSSVAPSPSPPSRTQHGQRGQRVGARLIDCSQSAQPASSCTRLVPRTLGQGPRSRSFFRRRLCELLLAKPTFAWELLIAHDAHANRLYP